MYCTYLFTRDLLNTISNVGRLISLDCVNIRTLNLIFSRKFHSLSEFSLFICKICRLKEFYLLTDIFYKGGQEWKQQKANGKGNISFYLFLVCLILSFCFVFSHFDVDAHFCFLSLLLC